jgi:hypothetical protein
MCYLLRYVAKENPLKPESSQWLIRQALIYQKVDLGSGETRQILVRLSGVMEQRLSYAIDVETLTHNDVWSDWTKIHTLCLDSIDTDLRTCVNHIYKRTRNVVRISLH